MSFSASCRVRSFVRSKYNPMFGAERFASTRRTFLLKLFTNDEAVSRARVVFPTPPFMDTNAKIFAMLSPDLDNDLGYIRFWLDGGSCLGIGGGCY